MGTSPEQLFWSQWCPYQRGSAVQHFVKKTILSLIIHCENTQVTSTTVLSCPSCISVTEKCYHIGFRLILQLHQLVSLFRRPSCLHCWHFYHNHATKDRTIARCCQILDNGSKRQKNFVCNVSISLWQFSSGNTIHQFCLIM